MNERIKKLKEQATRKAKWPGDPDAGELNAEKFAELIVRECANVVSDTEYPYINQSYKNTWDTYCVWSAAKLKEHFGVEE